MPKSVEQNISKKKGNNVDMNIEYRIHMRVIAICENYSKIVIKLFYFKKCLAIHYSCRYIAYKYLKKCILPVNI